MVEALLSEPKLEETQTKPIEELKDPLFVEEAKKKKKKNKKKKAKAEGTTEETKESKTEQQPEPSEKAEDSDSEEEKGDGDAQGKKKKKKKKSKKTGPISIPTGSVAGTRQQDNSHLINLGSWDAGEWRQTEPPMIPMTQLFKTGSFPIGEIQEHYGDHNRHRITSAELRAREKILESDYDALRRAAEVHRHTRKWAQKFIKPGMKVMDICNEIEATNRRLIEASGLDAGIAFPTGASLNHCAAHWTPNIGDETILQKDDVMKIDFGSHVRGIMTDCAFTVAFNPTYENLLKAVKDATDTGIRHSGIDARLCEIGEAIQETMESYEVEIKGKTYKVKSIANLCGHSIKRYQIHAGKSVPIVKNPDNKDKMEEGEQYAIETFGSTGKGHVWEDLDCSHYMQKFDYDKKPIRNAQAAKLLGVINQQFGTLAFCRKWLEEYFPRHIMPLKFLCDADIVRAYPPLVDQVGCYTAQYEHTILLRPTCKEVITRGPDY